MTKAMRKPELTGEQIELLREKLTEAERCAFLAAQASAKVRQVKETVGRARGADAALIRQYSKIVSAGGEAAAARVRGIEKLQRCGAKTRSGKPCQCQPEPGRDRCKLHGGRSTGARTEAGREAIRESNRRRAEARRAGSIDASLGQARNNVP